VLVLLGAGAIVSILITGRIPRRFIGECLRARNPIEYWITFVILIGAYVFIWITLYPILIGQ
jgi:hypothetical protein